ncbi:MAG: hypothetical protein K0R73_622 [Candidatus Midichloriaceae bacterium]|jgi:hypothetical protein|nr:hypothetical protein [Candidatus Midichloriaceae bacterium]
MKDALHWTRKTAAVTAFASAAIWGANLGIEKFNQNVTPFLHALIDFLGSGNLGRSLLSPQNLMIVALASQCAHYFIETFKEKERYLDETPKNFVNNALHGITGYTVAVAATCITNNLLGKIELIAPYTNAIFCTSVLAGGATFRLFDDYFFPSFIKNGRKIVSECIAGIYATIFTAAHNIVNKKKEYEYISDGRLEDYVSLLTPVKENEESSEIEKSNSL